MDAKNNLETVLFNKDGFTFIQVNKNHYKLLFSIENKNIIMSKIIDLHPDVYEYDHIEKNNDDEMNSIILMNHLP